MNLIQLRLLEGSGYKFEGVQRQARAAGGTHYVAVAIKGSASAEASGRTIREAEQRLVLCVTRRDQDNRGRNEIRFLRRMQRRYNFPWRTTR
jgi:hypothetical protein